MQIVGNVKEIWRYPVKGMAGEKLANTPIDKWGITGDRVWALRDVKRQEIQSCKFRPELLMCRASSRSDVNDPHVDIHFPCGTTLGSDASTIHKKLSELVGFESTLERLHTDLEPGFFRRFKGAKEGWLEELKSTFTRENDEPYPDFSNLAPEAEEFVTIPGSFFLVSPFHIITTSTLTYLKSLLPDSDWDAQRFRPNIIVDSPSNLEGLIEQSWIHRKIYIANIEVDCVASAPRCGAITRRQHNLPFDKAILRAVVKEAEQNLGVYGSVLNQGLISVGDEVRAG